MEFTMHGFQVYSAEVDDRGIDFVARRGDGGFFEVQVKSLREKGYLFIPKSKARLSSDRLIAVVLFTEGQEPELFLIPMTCGIRPMRSSSILTTLMARVSPSTGSIGPGAQERIPTAPGLAKPPVERLIQPPSHVSYESQRRQFSQQSFPSLASSPPERSAYEERDQDDDGNGHA
jgi:hypothetical protein